MTASTLPDHPAWMARDVLISDWQPSAVAGFDPTVPFRDPDGLAMSRGWYDTIDTDPVVALSNFSSPTTTESGYDGIDPTGAGATQQRNGSGLITIFAEGGREYGDGGLEADTLVFRLRQHIERIVMDANNEGRLPGPWTYASTGWDQSTVNTDPNPSVHQSQLSFYYGWNRTP